MFFSSDAVSNAAVQYHSHNQPADLHACEISTLHSQHSIPALSDCHDQYINNCEAVQLVKQKLREFHAELQALSRL